MASTLFRILKLLICVVELWMMSADGSADLQLSSQPTSLEIPIWIGEYPPGCNQVSAQHCEDEYLNCVLYTGPANDAPTICSCSATYYSTCLPLAGEILTANMLASGHLRLVQLIGGIQSNGDYLHPYRWEPMTTVKHSVYLLRGLPTRKVSDALHHLNAGCETAPQVGPFTNHDIYHRTCVDVIMANNCPDSTICAINCASNGPINATTSHILPINNYGNYYLRIRLCMDTVHPQSLKRFSTVNTVFCQAISDFTVCSRFIPPHSFIPVAIPKSVSSIVIDSCEIINGAYICHTIDPAPQRLYGNKFMFPSTYDVPIPDGSSCLHDCE